MKVPYDLSNDGQDVFLGDLRTASEAELKYDEIRDLFRGSRNYIVRIFGRGLQKVLYVNIRGPRVGSDLPYDQTQRHIDSNHIINEEFGHIISMENPFPDSSNLKWIDVNDEFDEGQIVLDAEQHLSNGQVIIGITTKYQHGGGSGVKVNGIGAFLVSNASQNMRLPITEKVTVLMGGVQDSGLPYWDLDTFVAPNVTNSALENGFISGVSYLGRATSRELNALEFFHGVGDGVHMDYDNGNKLLVYPVKVIR